MSNIWKNKKIRNHLFLGWVALHLSIVLIGASHYSELLLRAGYERLIYAYQAFSASDSTFGFFAPGVSADTRIVLRTFDGKKWNTTVVDHNSPKEVRLRFSTINGLAVNDNYRELIAASWASWGFAKFEDSLVIIVEIQYFHLPKMTDLPKEVATWKSLEYFNFTYPKRVFSHYAKTP